MLLRTLLAACVLLGVTATTVNAASGSFRTRDGLICQWADISQYVYEMDCSGYRYGEPVYYWCSVWSTYYVCHGHGRRWSGTP